jgi:hypothetical protein
MRINVLLSLKGLWPEQLQLGSKMIIASKKLITGLLTAWDGFWTVWLANIFWLVLCLPIITAPLAFTGLYFTMHELAKGESMEWNTFFYGIRRYFWPGLRWFGFTFAVILILIFYINFIGTESANSSGAGTDIVTGILLGLLVLWIIINTFTFPLMLEQEKPSYRTALTKSIIIYLKWPGFTLVFLLFNAIVIAICIWLIVPSLILVGSLTALMANVFVIDRAEELAAK